MIPVWIPDPGLAGLLVALFFYITTWWCFSNQESSNPKDVISVDVVSYSAQRKHLHPDCKDRFQAEKISNRERGHEEDTFKNTIFKLKNIPENFEKLEQSGIKYLRSKEFVDYWTFRRDDCSKPFRFFEAGQIRPSFLMKWDKYCHFEPTISEKRDVMWLVLKWLTIAVLVSVYFKEIQMI